MEFDDELLYEYLYGCVSLCRLMEMTEHFYEIFINSRITTAYIH